MTDGAEASAGRISFGSFHFLPKQQLLLDGETPVRLGSRARDILSALVERPGETVSKEELIARVWPDTFVEEGNLKVHVATLRRALGDGVGNNRYIANIPGRGYCFVAPIIASEIRVPPTPLAAERPQEVPARLARMVGRSDVVQSIIGKLPQHRFITIAGPGGIGKTTVALAVANGMIGKFRDGIRFVDLSPLTDYLLVPSALASALGVPILSENPLRSVMAFLRDKEILILLDNCEHLIEAAAGLAEEVFTGARSAHILATSREPLHASGERIYRLSALASPPASPKLTAAQALSYPAVQLFAECASTGLEPFELTDADAPVVAQICRMLDGIALAIEIAAVRVETFGVVGLAARLDDRFRLLMHGRRTALTRHQTLSTTLDWSYDLLPEVERVVLRRLAVFAGFFTMEVAIAVLSQAGVSASDIVDRVSNLVAKSLVSAGVDAGIARYRLLDTTRAYALVKLEEAGERNRFAGFHAEFCRRRLEDAEAQWRKLPAAEWLEEHRPLIDDVRAALDWAFSPSGDAAVGAPLTAAAIPLWFQLFLVGECCKRVERALAAPAASRDPHSDMVLHAALAWSLMQTRGWVAQTRAAWAAVLELAQRLGDVDYQLRALWGLWSGLLNGSEFREALALAERFCEVAATQPDRADLPVGDRMAGYILHLLGDQDGARRRIERMLAHYMVPVAGAQIIRFVFDQKLTSRCFLARILWLQGFPDRAMRIVEEVLEAAAAGEDMLTLCQALVQAACPIGLFVGDLNRVERFVDQLLDYSTTNGLEFWQAYGHCFKGVWLVERGDARGGLALLATGLAALRNIQFGVYYVSFLGSYAEASARVGEAQQGLAAIDEALERSERNQGRWCTAELLRIKGVVMLAGGAAGASALAETFFLQSLTVAREQRTLSWELRSAVSLARLWRDERAGVGALDLLLPIYERFTEGFATADLTAAAELIGELRLGGIRIAN